MGIGDQESGIGEIQETHAPLLPNLRPLTPDSRPLLPYFFFFPLAFGDFPAFALAGLAPALTFDFFAPAKATSQPEA